MANVYNINTGGQTLSIKNADGNPVTITSSATVALTDATYYQLVAMLGSSRVQLVGSGSATNNVSVLPPTTGAVTPFNGGGQSSATAITSLDSVNRITTTVATTAPFDSVKLPASGAGWVVIINSSANPIQVFGTGTDTINGVASGTGITQLANSVEVYWTPATGVWYCDSGVGFSGQLPVVYAQTSIAAAGTTQGAATQLVADFNKVTSASAGSAVGVILPAAKAGLDVLVENHSGTALTVFGNGTDTIDDVAGATGVQQMDSSVVLFTAYENGKYYSNGLATGYAKNPQSGTVLETMQYADALTATGSTQAGALQLTAGLNTVSTVAANTGANLPASAPGLQVTVINTGANSLLVYPAQGSSDTINGVAASQGVSIFPGVVATFNCTASGAWTVQPGTTRSAAYNTNAATSGTTLTAANVTGGGATVDLALTGTLGGNANAQLPTVAAMVAALHCPTVGTSFRLRVISQTASNTWTVTTNTGWTLSGTMTIAANTWREFVVTLNTLTTATLQSVATGTYS